MTVIAELCLHGVNVAGIQVSLKVTAQPAVIIYQLVIILQADAGQITENACRPERCHWATLCCWTTGSFTKDASLYAIYRKFRHLTIATSVYHMSPQQPKFGTVCRSLTLKAVLLLLQPCSKIAPITGGAFERNLTCCTHAPSKLQLLACTAACRGGLRDICAFAVGFLVFVTARIQLRSI